VALRPDELLSFGGDVLEANTTSAKERAAEPASESTQERRRFEEHLRELPASERPQARREHEAQRREIGKRLALAARQTYVLTRLHHRYGAATLPRDLELGPAPSALRGGIGVPSGRDGQIARAAEPAAEDQLQIRFLALHPWHGAIACRAVDRFRWGKAGPSQARTSRTIPLALGLSHAPRDRNVLERLLKTPLPELGLSAAKRQALAEASTDPPSEPLPVSAQPHAGGCSVALRATSNQQPNECLLCMLFVVIWLRSTSKGLLRTRRRSLIE
jgi:hypothetical protein